MGAGGELNKCSTTTYMSLSITVSFMLGSLADVVGPAAYDFQVNELMVVMQSRPSCARPCFQTVKPLSSHAGRRHTRCVCARSRCQLRVVSWHRQTCFVRAMAGRRH